MDATIDGEGVSSKPQVFFMSALSGVGTEVRARADELHRVIEKVVRRHGLDLVRADQLAGAGTVTAQIVEAIKASRLVIADISSENANVYYELGVAHSFGVPAILIGRADGRLPFDISHRRVLMFELNRMSMGKFTHELNRHIRATLGDGASALSDPVSVAIAIDEVEQRRRSTPQPDETLALLTDIRERLGGLEARVGGIESGPRGPSDPPAPSYSRRIFIVHGHDDALKLELRFFLERLDFEPIILHDQPDTGRTIFSKLRGESRDIGFAFVLLTPDDEGAKQGSKETNPRARQNVVFEHGLFIGMLAPSRVCAIVKDQVEIPSDLTGVIYKHLPIGAPLSSIAFELAKELRAAGYVVDLNKLT